MQNNLLNSIKKIFYSILGGHSGDGMEHYIHARIKHYAASPVLVAHFTDELHRLKARKLSS